MRGLASAVLAASALSPLAAAGTGCGPEAGEVSDGGELAEARGELRGDSALVALFREAEGQTGVPAELLAAVSWVQTRLSMNEGGRDGHEDHHHAPREWGLMAIGSGGLVTLEEVAREAGLEAARVAREPRDNVLAAAAWIAAERERRGDAGFGPSLEAFGGAPLAEAAQRLVRAGFSAVDAEGRALSVVGSGEPEPLPEGLGEARQALGYPGAKWSPAHSSNYKAASRGKGAIDYVVIHTTQGSYSGAISWFKNSSSNVSAHYIIRSSDGEVTQMVDDSDVAWHDACFNSNSIGIEHEGFVDAPGKWYTEEMYVASAKLTAWLCDKYGIPKDRKHIMGHGETPDCSSHTDPGKGWDWDYYMSLVKNGGVPPDADGDGIEIPEDNCPDLATEDLTDTDGDGAGDACDVDADGDEVEDEQDNCPALANADQADGDGDGDGDACDPEDDRELPGGELGAAPGEEGPGLEPKTCEDDCEGGAALEGAVGCSAGGAPSLPGPGALAAAGLALAAARRRRA